jgi:hypothetical protein
VLLDDLTAHYRHTTSWVFSHSPISSSYTCVKLSSPPYAQIELEADLTRMYKLGSFYMRIDRVRIQDVRI